MITNAHQNGNFKPYTIASHKSNGKIWEFISWPFQDRDGNWKIMARFEVGDPTTMQDVFCSDYTVDGKDFAENNNG